jgi:hypothetical protein
MKLAAVAIVNFFGNSEILQKIVLVDDDATWKDAYKKAVVEGICKEDIPDYWIVELSDNLDEARNELLDLDICVTFFEDGTLFLDEYSFLKVGGENEIQRTNREISSRIINSYHK